MKIRKREKIDFDNTSISKRRNEYALKGNQHLVKELAEYMKTLFILQTNENLKIYNYSSKINIEYYAIIKSFLIL